MVYTMTLNTSWQKKYAHLNFEQNIVAMPDTVTPIMSKNNLPTIKVGQYLLHSLYDPIKEAKKLAEIHYKCNHLHILFGFGLGYLAKEIFCKMGENDYLLIVEPNKKVFAYALESNDFDSLIQSDKVLFSISEDPSNLKSYFIFIVRNGYLGRTVLIESPNYAKLYPDLMQEALELLKEVSMLELVNINTIHHFAGTWQNNFLANIYQTLKAIPFDKLVKKLSCPVIITSAGPSLTKQLPLLRKLQNRAFILCAGSAINSLLLGDIKPNAIVTIDGGEANYKHFRELNIDSIPIIYTLTVHKDIIANHNGIQVIFNDNPMLSAWIEETLGTDIGIVRGGQSVANYCLDLACQISTGPVCFVGQDLAYTDNKSHAEGNKNATNLSQVQIEQGRRYVKTKGYYEDEVSTDYPFLAMKKTFEQFILYIRSEGDNRPIINATEGGAMIEGAVNMSFNKFVQLYCIKDYSNEIKALFSQEVVSLVDGQHIYNIINNEKKFIQHVIKICQKAHKIFKKIPSNKVKISQKTLNSLDKIDKRLKHLLENNFMYYILRPVIFRVQHGYPEPESETPEERTARILAKSEALYKEISTAARITEKHIIELLDKLNPHL